MKKQQQIVTMSTLVYIFLVIGVVTYTYSWLRDEILDVEFNQEGWDKGIHWNSLDSSPETPSRDRMVKSLLQKYDFLNKNEAYVDSIIGKPTSIHNLNSGDILHEYWLTDYYGLIGIDPVGGMDLHVIYDSKTKLVKEVKIYEY